MAHSYNKSSHVLLDSVYIPQARNTGTYISRLWWRAGRAILFHRSTRKTAQAKTNALKRQGKFVKQQQQQKWRWMDRILLAMGSKHAWLYFDLFRSWKGENICQLWVLNRRGVHSASAIRQSENAERTKSPLPLPSPATAKQTSTTTKQTRN